MGGRRAPLHLFLLLWAVHTWSAGPKFSHQVVTGQSRFLERLRARWILGRKTVIRYHREPPLASLAANLVEYPVRACRLERP